jgi:uncharacterized glyoxalase superfamily protein PhnB
MTPDPFESLAEPPVPLAPRPDFTAELRRRLHALTPYLSCNRAADAITWYQEVFDAQIVVDPIVMDDGKVGHCELRVGDSVFMLADEFDGENVVSPETLGGSSVALMLHVPDAEATFARALARGATEFRPVTDNHGARRGELRDPFGHRWFIATAVPDDVPIENAPGRRFGDVGYLTLLVPDGDRARAFYEQVFGWRSDASGPPGSYHVSSITPPSGISGGQETAEFRVFFRVDDIEAVAARIREAGGEVMSVSNHDSGGNAECRDDQGLRFDLFRPRAGY